MSTPILLEVYSDYVCPWCYLGDSRTKKLKENYNILVRFVHFPLHPETPKEGKLLEELFRCGPEDVEAKNTHMKNLMTAEGLQYNTRRYTYNSRLAQEIAKWAEIKMNSGIIHNKFFEAYFVYGRNIGDIEVIIDIIKTIGLCEEEARTVIAERSYKNAIDSDWAKSNNLGVSGVPTYVSNGQILTGAQPYHFLKELMDQIGAEKKPR